MKVRKGGGEEIPLIQGKSSYRTVILQVLNLTKQTFKEIYKLILHIFIIEYGAND